MVGGSLPVSREICLFLKVINFRHEDHRSTSSSNFPGEYAPRPPRGNQKFFSPLHGSKKICTVLPVFIAVYVTAMGNESEHVDAF